MQTTNPSIPCPSCGAMLDSSGHCVYCGGQARGFWDSLDLGTPELAAAIMQGMDYYLVLGVSPTAEPTDLGVAYRQARSRFPDDPRRLVQQLARYLGLIEEAWRILGVPERREVYDRLRREQSSATASRSNVRTLRCPQCGAPFAPNAQRCTACGTPRPAEAVPNIPRPLDDIPDYYAVLGLSPQLMRVPSGNPARRASTLGWQALLTQADSEPAKPDDFVLVPPEADEIEAAYLRRRQALAFQNDPSTLR